MDQLPQSANHIMFRAAPERRHEPIEALRKVRDLQFFAQQMLRRDLRVKTNSIGLELNIPENDYPSLDWSHENEDGSLTVYAMVQYHRRGTNKGEIKRMTVGYKRGGDKSGELIFDPNLHDLDALSIASVREGEQLVDRIHAAFEEIFGYEE